MKKYLDFKGKLILFTLVDGEYWVAIKPICEALGVNYNRQFQNIKSDKILSQLFAKQQTTGADGKQYQMICLPEKYIYGWLFALRSDSEVLADYKKKCYDLLFDYFSGTITKRKKLLSDRSLLEDNILTIEDKLSENDDFQKWQELQKEKRKLNKQLKGLDGELVENVLTFNHPSSNKIIYKVSLRLNLMDINIS